MLVLRNFKAYLPVIAFFAGFLWDALTIGRSVSTLDLWLLLGYLLAAAALLAWLGYRLQRPMAGLIDDRDERQISFLTSWLDRVPYLLLQFLLSML